MTNIDKLLNEREPLDTPCRKCGGSTSLRWIHSTGLDIEPTGMKRTCMRCGFSEFIKSLDDE